MDTITTLIDVFTESSTNDVETNGQILLDAFRKSHRDELLAIPDYATSYSLAHHCAHLVDNVTRDYPSDRAQVTESIRLLRRLVDDHESSEKVNVTRSLIIGRLRDRRWSAAERSRFDAKLPLLEWRDFFISYTDRDAPAMNHKFRELIRSSVVRSPKDEKTRNFVARVLVRQLSRYEQLSGFFAETELKIGETIGTAVDGYCDRAFALLQLVESVSFDRQPPKNWCFHEFSTFSASPTISRLFGNKVRHFFVLSEASLNDVLPTNLVPAYDDWRERISESKQLFLDPVLTNSTLRPKVREIAQSILKLRQEIIDAWSEE